LRITTNVGDVSIKKKKKSVLPIGLKNINQNSDIRIVVTESFDLHINVKINYRFKLLQSISPDSPIEQQCQLETVLYCHTIM